MADEHSRNRRIWLEPFWLKPKVVQTCTYVRQVGMAEAVVVASCPQPYQQEVAAVCKRLGLQKAFGRAGDMVDSLSGKDWVSKWEAKVVMATVTKAQTLGTSKATILCIAGGPFCDLEMAKQPSLVRAIKKEMEDESFRVGVHWMEIEDFRDRYRGPPAPDEGKGAGGNMSKGMKQLHAIGDGKGTNKKQPCSSNAIGCGKGADKKEPEQHQGQLATEDRGKGKGKKAPEQQRAQPKTSGGSSAAGAASVPKKKAQCRYWAAGCCKNGRTCAFAHVEAGSSACQVSCEAFGSRQMG